MLRADQVLFPRPEALGISATGRHLSFICEDDIPSPSLGQHLGECARSPNCHLLHVSKPTVIFPRGSSPTELEKLWLINMPRPRDWPSMAGL
jgi:hypothetical protein